MLCCVCCWAIHPLSLRIDSERKQVCPASACPPHILALPVSITGRKRINHDAESEETQNIHGRVFTVKCWCHTGVLNRSGHHKHKMILFVWKKLIIYGQHKAQFNLHFQTTFQTHNSLFPLLNHVIWLLFYALWTMFLLTAHVLFWWASESRTVVGKMWLTHFSICSTWVAVSAPASACKTIFQQQLNSFCKRAKDFVWRGLTSKPYNFFFQSGCTFLLTLLVKDTLGMYSSKGCTVFREQLDHLT